MKLTTIPRIKKICMKQKRFQRRRALRAYRIAWQMEGGPMHKAWLCTPGTLRFSIPGWNGYYDSENRWVEL